jgi:hypothetical protein
MEKIVWLAALWLVVLLKWSAVVPKTGMAAKCLVCACLCLQMHHALSTALLLAKQAKGCVLVAWILPENA